MVISELWLAVKFIMFCQCLCYILGRNHLLNYCYDNSEINVILLFNGEQDNDHLMFC
jgi:hypothetical protein